MDGILLLCSTEGGAPVRQVGGNVRRLQGRREGRREARQSVVTWVSAGSNVNVLLCAAIVADSGIPYYQVSNPLRAPRVG